MSTVTAGVYAQHSLEDLTPAIAADLKGSGFTTIIWFCLHVNSGGDIHYNSNTPLVGGGRYVGPSSWAAALSGLTQGTTAVNRILFAVGGSPPSTDFTHIRRLINKHGTGPDSPLHRNFHALKNALPAIDGIDFDYEEDVLEQDTIVAFAQMLHGLGYQVTFCPYQPWAMDVWVDSLYALNSATPGLVTQFNLQCYGGGAGNSPKAWIDAIAAKMGSDFDADGFVIPGVLCNALPSCSGSCPETVQDTYEGWAQQANISGGFIWRYEHITQCTGQGGCSGSSDTAAYAAAILDGLAPPES